MSANLLKGNLNEFKDKIKEEWGKLRDEDINSLNGDVHQLANILQQRLGYAKEQASTAAQEFIEGFKGNYKNNNKDKDSNREENKGQAGDEISDMGKDAWEKTTKIAKNVKEEAREYGKAMAKFVEQKPYQSIAIAGVAGLVFGLLFRKN